MQVHIGNKTNSGRKKHTKTKITNEFFKGEKIVIKKRKIKSDLCEGQNKNI